MLELKAKAGYFASEQSLFRYGQSVQLDRCLPELGGNGRAYPVSDAMAGIHKVDNQLELTTDKQ